MEPGVYFDKTIEAYAVAAERGGSVEYRLDLAGRGVRLRFASVVAAERLMPALAHRASASAVIPESLDILVWDTASTGVSPPPPPWDQSDFRARGEIHGFEGDGVRTAFHPGPDVLSMYDSSTGTALFWTPDAGALPDYQVGSPFLHILHWWSEANRLTLIHAGSVGAGGAGVLLAGRGGSGKSTTALACAWSGMHYVSDDYCLLETAGSDRVHSVFNTGKLDAHSLALLPQYRALAADQVVDAGEKAMIFLKDAMPDRMAAALPVHAVLLPQPSGRDRTRVRSASPGEALRALAPSTIFQLSGAGGLALKELGDLVRRVACYRLDLSRDMRDAPEAVNSILERYS